MNGRRGFTLLEVMVSMGILALSLTAIAGISAGSYASSEYARNISIATLLARSKMIDIEEEMWEDGRFPTDDKELNGDFDDENQPNFRWRASVRKIEVDVGQLVGSLLGGDVDTENMGEHIQGFISGLSGGGGELGSEAETRVNEQIQKSELGNLLNGDALGAMFEQVGENLKEAIREVELEIEWGPKNKPHDSIVFVQYIVTTGRINTPRGGIRLPASTTGTAFPGHRNANTLTPPAARSIPGKQTQP